MRKRNDKLGGSLRRQRGGSLMVNISCQDVEALRLAADELHLSVSELVRRCVKKALIGVIREERLEASETQRSVRRELGSAETEGKEAQA